MLEPRQLLSATAGDVGFPDQNLLNTKCRVLPAVAALPATSAKASSLAGTAAMTGAMATTTRRDLQSSDLTVVPTAPTGLTAVAMGTSQVVLNWTDTSKNETGFKIERSTGTAGRWIQIASVGTNVRTFTDRGLTAATAYFYRVRASNPTGNSAYSNTAGATTAAILTAPAAPTGLSALALSSSEMALQWTDNSDSESGFEVERALSGSAMWTRVTTVPANVTALTDTGLLTATSYTYRVRAVNTLGGSGYATATQTTKSPVKQFSISDLRTTYDTPGWSPGFGVHEILVKPNGSDGPTTLLSAALLSVVTLDANTLLEVFQTPGKEATIEAKLTTQGDDRLMEVKVTAGAAWTITSITLNGPYILAPSSEDLQIYHPFKGGVTQPWRQDAFHVEGAAAWPNNEYSPMAVFYNAKTTEGVGFVAFDGGLEQRSVFWVTAAGLAEPYVRWEAAIKGGQSATTTLHEHHGFNMPTAQFGFYRDNFLVPFMESEGVPEGTMTIDGVIGLNFWPDGEDVMVGVKEALGWGAKGYLQYTPPTASYYYEPNAMVMPWYPTMKSASTAPGLQLFGVLINPLVKSLVPPPTNDPTSPLWYPYGDGAQSLADPAAQKFLLQLKNSLVAQGVNYAYWDTGAAGPTGEGRLWFDLLKSWKQAGISIAAESSCDVASYVTGTNLIFWYQDASDYAIMSAVTPKARIGVIDQRRLPENGKYWWDIAASRGFVPMLDQKQLPIRYQLLGK
jgi:hypothetical protein